ncbi:MAG TPA: DUF3284 domain-containing protein [Bavariicoccus seileri]|uniref:DUF3284 domain-containing protein n=1 Tax=Bavariicoccus seileri TaxID=549685 RepID=A0A3D4S4W6_9ENTE|nr:DUF3284 domain-containing protein [Bavariicoccus seileri]HCS93628.1 DUF3284 domain-containing protein [Bavariicoccus seileri]
MELTQSLSISAKQLYHVLITSTLADIKQQTGQELSPKDLKGYSFEKSFQGQGKALFKVLKVEPDTCYRYELKSTRNTYTVSYEIKKIDEKSCRLHYSEKMESVGFLQSMNDMIVGTLMSPFKKKRFKKMLTSIEENVGKS